jgi:23S rRNA pseudouridine2605 synthase
MPWAARPGDDPDASRDTEGECLQKVMAAAGVASRRVSEELIAAGRVTVNGRVVTEPGSRIDPTRDMLAVDGTAVQLDASKRYVMLNKPTGVVSSMRDERGRPDLRGFVSEYEERLYNVGRLDAETSGLLLLTNDGEATHVLAHPSFGVTKTYIATVRGRVAPATLGRLLRGIDLDDGPIAADKARLVQASAGESIVEITLHSGRNRIVRRMLDGVGHPVTGLGKSSASWCGPVEDPHQLAYVVSLSAVSKKRHEQVHAVRLQQSCEKSPLSTHVAPPPS